MKTAESPRPVTLILLTVATVATSQSAAASTLCNLVAPRCSIACGGNAPFSFPVWHETQDICGAGGSINLVGTEYESLCSESHPSCAGVGAPFIRYWEFDRYNDGNSGCLQYDEPPPYAYNGLQLGAAPGHWILLSNWQAFQAADGFVIPQQRGVLEVAEVERSLEGQTGHSSWYLVGSIGQSKSSYDFDRLRGGDGDPARPGCTPGDMPVHPVPGVTIRGAAACRGPGAGLTRSIAGAPLVFVTMDIDEPSPTWFTEVGRNDPAVPMIEGYQILYALGAEPTSSRFDPLVPVLNRLWKEVLDPLTGNPLAVVAYGRRRASIALPGVVGTYWLAARLVYTDCSLNGSKSGNTGCLVVPPGTPPVGSQLSAHCGPLDLVP